MNEQQHMLTGHTQPDFGQKEGRRVYYNCTCGAAGSLDTPPASQRAWEKHAQDAAQEERLERIRAAAPELLEALKAVYPALENHILPAHDQAVRDRYAQVLQQVEHAIAKAEGRQQ